MNPAAEKVSRELAYELDALPISYEQGQLVLGLPPLNGKLTNVLARLEEQTRCEITVRTMSHQEIREGLARIYPAGASREETHIEQLFARIVKTALNNHASDIHIEYRDSERGRVRLRIDDINIENAGLSCDDTKRLISSIKMAAKIDVSEHTLPLDGRIKRDVDGRSIDMRVSAITGAFGQKLALRLLGRFESVRAIEEFGIESETLDRVVGGMLRPGAFVINAGPTGSGKTTFLYSMLRRVDLTAWNVYSVEDPIEILVPAMTQIPVKEKAGMTFGEVTRAFVRQDPDLLMIGELRDTETVRECLALSTSGQRLWSTTHAKSAIHIVNRLVRLGASRRDIADTLTLGISQRLLRRLCMHCRKSSTLSDQARKLLEQSPRTAALATSEQIYDANGCPRCHHTGYSGRFAVLEFFEVTPQVQDAIKNDRASLLDIARAAARSGGYRPMVFDGLRHVLAGDTSETEVLRKLAYEETLL